MDEVRFYEQLGLNPPPGAMAAAPEVEVPEVLGVPYGVSTYLYGDRVELEAFRAEFGELYWLGAGQHEAATHHFKLAALFLEKLPNPTQLVQVVNEEWNPVLGVPIVRAWAWPNYDAEKCPRLTDWTDEYPQTMRWTDKGNVAMTDGYGQAEFNMGHGDAFFRDRVDGGYSCIYPAHPSGSGDIVHRLGWLDGTGYMCCRAIYQKVEAGGNGPGPGPEGKVRVFIEGIELVGSIVAIPNG